MNSNNNSEIQIGGIMIPIEDFSYFDKSPVLEMVQYNIDNVTDDNSDVLEMLQSFNSLYKVNDNNAFTNESIVKKFISQLTSNDESFAGTAIFSGDPDSPFYNQLQNTLWLMPSVKSCKALKELIENNTAYNNMFNVIDISGDNMTSEQAMNAVRAAIDSENNHKMREESYRRTITLTVSRLTAGVTVPEWDGVLMMSNTESAITYMQTAYRCMSTYVDNNGKPKSKSFVIDFNPNRMLHVMYDIMLRRANVKNENNITKNESLKMTELLETFNINNFNISNGELKKITFETIADIQYEIDSDKLFKYAGNIQANSIFNMHEIREYLDDSANASIKEAFAKMASIKTNSVKLKEKSTRKTASYDKSKKKTSSDKEILNKGNTNDANEPKNQNSNKQTDNAEGYDRIVYISANISQVLMLTVFYRRIIENAHKHDFINDNQYADIISNQFNNENWSLCDSYEHIHSLNRMNLITGIPDFILEYLCELGGITYNNKIHDAIDHIISNYSRLVFESYLRTELYHINEIIQTASDDDINVYMRAIMEYQDRFKNPISGIVNTPSWTVNKHLTSTVGGYSWFNDDINDDNDMIKHDILNEPVRVWEHVFNFIDGNEPVNMIDMASKDGLYTLMLTYDAYMSIIANPFNKNFEHHTNILNEMQWLESVKHVSIQSLNNYQGMIAYMYMMMPLIMHDSNNIDYNNILEMHSKANDDSDYIMQTKWFTMNIHDLLENDLTKEMFKSDNKNKLQSCEYNVYAHYVYGCYNNGYHYGDVSSRMKSYMNSKMHKMISSIIDVNTGNSGMSILSESDLQNIAQFMMMRSNYDVNMNEFSDSDLKMINEDIIGSMKQMKNDNVGMKDDSHESVKRVKKALGLIKSTIDSMNASNDNHDYNHTVFELAVGNPPYNIQSTDEITSSTMVYPFFFFDSIAVSNKVALIHPHKWANNDTKTKVMFDYMKTCDNIISYHYINANDVFPDVNMSGNICWYLFDCTHHGAVRIYNHNDDTKFDSKTLLTNDVVFLNKYTYSILSKIKNKKSGKNISSIISGRMPFGIRSNYEDKIVKDLIDDDSSSLKRILIRKGAGLFGRKPAWLEVTGKALPKNNSQIESGYRIYLPHQYNNNFGGGEDSYSW